MHLIVWLLAATIALIAHQVWGSDLRALLGVLGALSGGYAGSVIAFAVADAIAKRL
jgi:hypothetical protein